MGLKKYLFELKYKLYSEHALEWYEKLQESQYMALGQQRDIQQTKLKSIIMHVVENSPFYKSRYSTAGFEVKDMDNGDFFEKLPVLTKQDVREQFAELQCIAYRKHAAVSTTGGSTGIPARIFYDSRFAWECFAWRMMAWWGLDPSMDGAFVWRNLRTSKAAEIFNKVLWYPTRKIRIDASELSSKKIVGFLRKFNKVKPALLQGYVGAVAEVASFVQRECMCVHRPKAVWLTSAPITTVHRSLIEATFGAPVYDQYGCCEAPFIAAQCRERGGLHVNIESVLLEFVDEENRPVPDGEWGRTLVTKLDERVFPLIRYEVGDRGRWLKAKCPCGVALPMIDKVKGRTTDMVRLPSGKVISGEYLTTIFDRHPDEVEAFRVVQRADWSIDVEFVPSACKADGAVIAEVARVLECRISGEVPLRMKPVAAIPHDRGKLKFVISQVMSAS